MQAKLTSYGDRSVAKFIDDEGNEISIYWIHDTGEIECKYFPEYSEPGNRSTEIFNGRFTTGRPSISVEEAWNGG